MSRAVDDQLREAGIAPLTLGHTLDRLRATLVQVEELGLRWHSTRFRRYADVIEEARGEIAAGSLEWAKDQPRRALLLEALGQATQLSNASSLWRRVPRDIIKMRLGRVFSGPDLPVEDPETADHSRNTLLELATAAALSSVGGGTSINADPEDALFHLSPELVLPIECKRPATAKTVGRNVVRVRDQLAERKQRYPHGGIAVIGIDRVIDTQTSEQAIEQERSPNAVATLAEARELSERMLHEWALAVAALGGPRLTEVAPVVMTALFGAVICLEPVVPIILARMAWHTLPNGTPERDDLLATLRSAMQ